MIKFNEIGFIRSSFREHADSLEMQRHVSHIIINEAYEEGLARIEEKSFLQVLYQFHLCGDKYELSDDTYTGSIRGIFASRGTRRPNNIGLTTVKLQKKKGNILTVIGLDALDGSPVLDIKPFNPKLDNLVSCPYLIN